MSGAREEPASLRATAPGELTLDPFSVTREGGTAASQGPAREAGGLLPCGAQVGRYVVLAQLGQGGMGVVYAAYDPELDRKVALKLIAGETAALAEDRLQREARAMAQLAHPNVVTVHDVGTLAGRLWIAMEFVDGVTLSDWIRERRRGWREVLAMYLAAGEGLVAAHRAGIVHRDFKPDNVMVGADGRARVMDFGLARAGTPTIEVAAPAGPSPGPAGLGAVTHVGAVLGTPRYMAPEQWAGRTSDARTDEFAFCMALWEGLFGQPPMAGQTMAEQALAVTTGQFMPVPSGMRVPGWVRRACRRGLAVEPTQRWDSMTELLAALRRDPAPRRRRLAAAAGVLLAVGGVWGGAEVRAARRDAACTAAAGALDASWNPALRAQVEAAMLASGVERAAASFARAQPWLDRFAERWAETAGATCRAATIERTLEVEQAARIASCLDERRAEIDELVATLLRGEPSLVRPAAASASLLSDPRTCGDTTRLAGRGGWTERDDVAELRRGLMRTGVLRRSGQLGPAAATAAAIELRAAALDAPLVLAWARLEVGLVANGRGDFVAARRHLEAAFYGAGAAAGDELAEHAAQWLLFLVGWELGETEVGLAWGRIAEMLLARLKVPALDRRRADVDGDTGVVLLRHGDVDGALARLRASVAVYEQLLGPDHPDVAPVLNNLAAAYHDRGEYDTSLAMLERLRAIEARTLGPESADVALTRGNIAALHQALGRIDEAREGFAWTAAILEKRRGPDHPDVAAALINLAGVESDGGAVDEALLHVRRALAIREKALGPDNDLVAAALDAVGGLEATLGQLPAALAAHRRALAIYERNHGPKHPELAIGLRGIGDALLKQGAVDEAHANFQRALALDETQPPPAAASSLYGLGDVALARRDYAAARELFMRAGAIVELHYGAEHPARNRALVGRGEAELGLGEVASATALFERALEVQAGKTLAPADDGAIRFALARALWAGVDARPRALREARAARDELRSTGARGRATLAEIEAWLARRRG